MILTLVYFGSVLVGVTIVAVVLAWMNESPRGMRRRFYGEDT